jgi:integrase
LCQFNARAEEKSVLHLRMKKLISITHKGITIKLRKNVTVVNGHKYINWIIPEYTSGKRVRHKRASFDQARVKAIEICEAITEGKQEIIAWESREWAEIRRALEILPQNCLRIDRAAQIVMDSLQHVDADSIVEACRYFRKNRPDGGDFTPKLTKDACREILTKQQGKISEHRHKTNTSYLKTFITTFGERNLHEIKSVEIADMANSHGWSKRTRNDFLGTISLLYRESIERGWTLENAASSGKVKREALKGSNIGIFTPQEVRRMLAAVGDELAPFLALWCFSGCRAAEIARLSWGQINQALESGALYLEANQTKTGMDRSVPIYDSLRAWLVKHRQPSGPVMPKKWQSVQGLSEIARHIARRCKVDWKKNAPRHSYATYHLALHKDPATTVKSMGTSLSKLEKHYWSRAECVTAAVAQDWFDIRPTEPQNVIPIDAPEADSAPIEAEPVSAAAKNL